MPSRKRRQRGSILSLPSGSYRVTVYAGRDVLSGKTRQLRETAKTYDDAKKVLTGPVSLIWPHRDGLIWPHLRHAGDRL